MPYILAQSNDTGFGWEGTIIWFAAIAGFFYFFVIRPNRKRRETHRTLMDSLGVGDEVRTVGGIYGRVQELDEESALVQVEGGTSIRFARGAIQAKITEDDKTADDEA